MDPTRIDKRTCANLVELRRRFEAGEKADASMLSSLGYHYKSLVHRTAEDERTVFEIFRELAERGSVSAMCELAYLYRIGFGTATNYAESLAWYRKARAAGNHYGTLGLAVAYRFGYGVPADLPHAVELYKEAGEHGVGGAAYELGVIYENGLLGKTDIREAIRWHKESLQAASNPYGGRERSEERLKHLERNTSQGR